MATHGASLIVCQNEWRSAHSALSLCAASVAITCTNARAVSMRLWGSLTILVLLAVSTHIWRPQCWAHKLRTDIFWWWRDMKTRIGVGDREVGPLLHELVFWNRIFNCYIENVVKISELLLCTNKQYTDYRSDFKRLACAIKRKLVCSTGQAASW